jgi:hypothetical protein
MQATGSLAAMRELRSTGRVEKDGGRKVEKALERHLYALLSGSFDEFAGTAGRFGGCRNEACDGER